MENQFFGGAMQQQHQAAMHHQQAAQQHQYAAMPHFPPFGYVPQPFPYMPPAAAPPPPPPPAMLGPPQLPQSFFNPWDPPPPPVAPPADIELQKRIDKLVEFSVKNGPGFEALMKEKQKENPAYGFLFGGDGHNYYKYKLWVTINPHNPPHNPHNPHILPFNPPVNMVSPPHHPALGLPTGLNPPPPSASTHFPPYFDMQHPSQAPMMQQQPMFDPGLVMKGVPMEMAAELRTLLETLTGTKDSIKNARMWFMHRSAFAPVLAESLRERINSIDNVERQMHVLYLVNDILFNSAQIRANPKELDAQAIAFRPVLSSILGAIHQNPNSSEADRAQVEKMLQFWGTKDVYDPETIKSLDKEMRGPPPAPPTTTAVSSGQGHNEQCEQTDEQQQPGASDISPASQQSNADSLNRISPLEAINAQQPQTTAVIRPYPHFPPGLIPGMVRKRQLGSGVPYSPIQEHDIPSIVSTSSTMEPQILDRVSKFFSEIGVADPLAKTDEAEEADDEWEEDRRRDRPRGARIPPPPSVQAAVDPQTATLPDGSMEHRPGMTSTGRLGLGASADPNEVTPYDDVYTSYRKQRSTTYHSSMSARAAAR